MIEETYGGVPREKIPWRPKINYDKCISCGRCVEFCHNYVFDFKEKAGKRLSVVKNPNNGVVFCRGCEDICPTAAITHPSEEETQKVIDQLKKRRPQKLRR